MIKTVKIFAKLKNNILLREIDSGNSIEEIKEKIKKHLDFDEIEAVVVWGVEKPLIFKNYE
jgi:hypothetical protein